MNQRNAVLEYIERFGSISSWDAYKDLGVTQLATRIFELKERGYRFRKEKVHFTTRLGKKSYYEEYYLDEYKHTEEDDFSQSAADSAAEG